MATCLYSIITLKNKVITISNELSIHLKYTKTIQLINSKTGFQSKTVNATRSTYTLHNHRSLVGH